MNAATREKKETEAAAPPMGVCGYWVKSKRRWCGLKPLDETCRFCNTHSQDLDRVPCPIDPSHTVAKSRLRRHIRVCQKGKEIAMTTTEPYYEKNINAGGCGHSVNKASAMVWDELEIEEDDAFETKRVWPTHAERHAYQGKAIVTALSKTQEDAIYIDLGSGRGGLGAAVRDIYPEAPLVFVDYDAPRKKFDRFLRGTDFIRLKCDLKDLNLNKISFLHTSKKKIAIAKHLCGAATDFALKAITQCADISAIAIATCCHHRCNWDSYVGRDFNTRALFSAAVRYAPWSNTVPDSDLQHDDGHAPALASDTFAPNEDNFLATAAAACSCQHSRFRFGRRCKRLIDIGRIEYLRSHGFEARIQPYCHVSTSPENMLILAVKAD